MIDDRLLYETLGARLKQLREGQAGGKRGRLTQGELADLVGLERTSITNIEAGNQKLPLHVLFRLCEQLGVSPVDILPTVKEVTEQAPAEEAFNFGGATVNAPRLVAQALAELLSPPV